MTLLLCLDPASFIQVSCSHVKCVFHEFIKFPIITEVELKQYPRANIFVIINALGALQDNSLKNDHLIRDPLPSSYTIEIHRKGSKNLLSYF